MALAQLGHIRAPYRVPPGADNGTMGVGGAHTQERSTWTLTKADGDRLHLHNAHEPLKSLRGTFSHTPR